MRGKGSHSPNAWNRPWFAEKAKHGRKEERGAPHLGEDGGSHNPSKRGQKYLTIKDADPLRKNCRSWYGDEEGRGDARQIKGLSNRCRTR